MAIRFLVFLAVSTTPLKVFDFEQGSREQLRLTEAEPMQRKKVGGDLCSEGS